LDTSIKWKMQVHLFPMAHSLDGTPLLLGLRLTLKSQSKLSS